MAMYQGGYQQLDSQIVASCAREADRESCLTAHIEEVNPHLAAQIHAAQTATVGGPISAGAVGAVLRKLPATNAELKGLSPFDAGGLLKKVLAEIESFAQQASKRGPSASERAAAASKDSGKSAK